MSTGTKRAAAPMQREVYRLKNTIGVRTRLLIALPWLALLLLTAPGVGFAQKNVDPARLAAAKELMEVAGSAKQFDAAAPLLTQQLESVFVKLRPEHAAKIKDIFRMIPERFSQRKQELLDQIAVLYAERLTADELNEIVKFYKSPIGSKFVRMQPELVQQSMVLGQIWGRKIGQEIDQEARKQLKEQGVSI